MSNLNKESLEQSFKKFEEKLEIIQNFTELICSQKQSLIPYVLISIIEEYCIKNITRNGIINSCKYNISLIKGKFEEEAYFDNINKQYKMYIETQIININWSSFAFLETSNINSISSLIKNKNNADYVLSNRDQNIFQQITHLINNIDNYLLKIQDILSSVLIFDKIRYVKDNIVLIGANGSGKSRFSRGLREKFDSLISVISAQHLLLYNKTKEINLTTKYHGLVHHFQNNDKLKESEYSLYNNDFQYLVSALILEHIENAKDIAYEGKVRTNSILYKIFDIWESLIENRKLILNKQYSIDVAPEDSKKYDFNDLSDGEKAIFYYSAHVLLAKTNSYIVIDEPENHLHLSICNKLWDILEKEREDCNFIYITHNVDFAVSRNNKTLIWNKNFEPPSNWEIEFLDDDSIIPETLLIELLGSKKKILFCEGDKKSSIDSKLYNILFPMYTIIPVGGHLDVINHCKAYNAGNYGNTSIGLIDGDFHKIEQIQSWENAQIFVLPFNEPENLICTEEVLQLAVSKFEPSSSTAIEDYKRDFFDLFEQSKERKATEFACFRVNITFKENMLKEKADFNNLRFEFESTINSQILEEYYNEYIEKVNRFIANKDFDGGIIFCSLKKEISLMLTKKHIVDKYEDRILSAISKDNEIQSKLVEMYFSNIPLA